MRVAIVGTAPSSFKDAPFDSDWEIWGLAKYRDAYLKIDKMFEIHASGTTQGPDEGYFTEDYLEFLSNHYVVGWNPKFPYAEVNELRRLNSKEWHLQSSIAYMIAYAILKGATEIGVWGVDLVDDEEYQGQKAFVEGWLCFAEGRGIKIYTPDASALFKSPYKYGLEKPTTFEDKTKNDSVRYLKATAQEHAEAAEKYKPFPDIYHYLSGASEAYINSSKMLQSTNQGYPVGSGMKIDHNQITNYIKEHYVRSRQETKTPTKEEV